MSGFNIAVDSEFQKPYIESIYNLIPIPLQKTKKEKRYKSRHDPLQKINHSLLKENGPNLGNAVKCHADPSQFLKRGAAVQNKPTLVPLSKSGSVGSGERKENVNPFAYPLVCKSKPLVPLKHERPIMSLHASKNFITANAVDVILKVPLAAVSKEPSYINKDDFGKVPGYLKDVKKEIISENELIDDFVRQQMSDLQDRPDYVEELPEEVRENLIEKLKSKWDAVNKKYQVLCMHTIYEGGKKAQKEGYEVEMNGIESDLEKLMKTGPVVVQSGI